MTVPLRRDTAREKRREQGRGLSAELSAEFLRPPSYPNAVGMGAAFVGVFIVGRRVRKRKKKQKKKKKKKSRKQEGQCKLSRKRHFKSSKGLYVRFSEHNSLAVASGYHANYPENDSLVK